MYPFFYKDFNPYFSFKYKKRKIITSSPSGPTIPTNGIIVDPDGTGDYTSLFAAEAAERILNSDTPVIFICISSGGSADTGANVAFYNANWGSTPIQIWQGQDDRHNGTPSSSIYRINNSITITCQNVIIDGIQSLAIISFLTTLLTTGSTLTIRNCLQKSSAALSIFATLAGSDSGSQTVYVHNNIGRTTHVSPTSYNGISMGTKSSGLTAYIEHNTFLADNSQGIKIAGGTAVAKNNIIKSDFSPVADSLQASSNYNATNQTGSTGFDNANDREGQTFTFENEANGDLRITNLDAGAKGYGTASLNISYDYDIAGNPWSTPRSIGANEPQ